MSGFTVEELEAFADEAERGFDIHDRQWMENPHFQSVLVVPDDLVEALNSAAERSHEAPQALVRRALEDFLQRA